MLIADGNEQNHGNGYVSQQRGNNTINIEDLRKVYRLLIKIRPLLKNTEDKEAFGILVKKVYEMEFCAWKDETYLIEAYKEKLKELQESV